MNRTDREDATARALDLLPPGDPAGGDPRLLRDACLLEEAKATREAAADVWLAVSPLSAAPPEVLHSIMEKIGPELPVGVRKNSRLGLLLAGSGWAAAVVIAFAWWPRQAGESVTSSVGPAADGGVGTPVLESSKVPTKFQERPRADSSELRKLREALEAMRRDESRHGPRVMNLRPPGAPRRSDEEIRGRIMALLGDALRTSLEVESGAPDDPATVVIERGWLSAGMAAAEDGTMFRHRNFPENSWREFGLLRSEEGSYYDPGSGLVWAPDPEGRGFLGSRAGEEVDLAGFRADGEGGDEPQPRREPEGFVIEDPVTREARVVIDSVPPAGEGNELRVVWTDVSGREGSVALGSTEAGISGNWTAGGMASFGIPNSAGLKSFQLIETAVGGGSPPRVIVTSGP
jgi:hypothetical protein